MAIPAELESSPTASVPLHGGKPAHADNPANRATILEGSPPVLPPAPPDAGPLPPFYPVLQPGRQPAPDLGPPGSAPFPQYPPRERPLSAPPVRRATAGGSRWRRGTATRDIAIGCAIAALVVAAFVSVKFLAFGDEPRAEAEVAPTGTILVVVRDAQQAEVTVDGKVVGAAHEQSPLTLSDLPPGPHTVQVTRAGAPACDRKVDLESRKVEVVECSFPKAPTYGRLILEGLDPSHRVFVDDQEVSAEAAREPLALTPGVEHAIQIKSGAAAPETIDEFTVELDPDQEMRRAIKPSRSRDRGRDGDRRSRERSSVDSSSDSSDSLDLRDEPDEDDRPPVKAAALSNEPGSFTAFTQPFARVYIDGKDTGKMTPIAPRSAIPLAPGKHEVTFVVGDQSFKYTINVAPGERKNLVKTLRPE